MIYATFVSFFLVASVCGMAARADTQAGVPRAQLASDALIESILKSKFAGQQAFGLQNLSVHSENAVIHLNGTLITLDAMDLAMRLTMATPGVVAAYNNILLAR
jgi:osmotically-inducible protein OsmY